MSRLPGPIPPSLNWLKASKSGRDWLDSLPDLVEQCAARWDLRVGAPFPYAFTALAMAAQLGDGSDAVLKLCFVDRETEHEGLALRHWGGQGAIRLLDEHASRHALLLERCIPGTPLAEAGPDVALPVLARVLPRLWTPAPAPPFRSLSDEAARWASHLRRIWDRDGDPFEERLIHAALDALDSLRGSQGEQVLLHQDLHGGNVLAAQREPWLVIDPKPLVGEREFGLAPIVRSSELGPSRRDLRRRLDHLTSELGLDRERARLWCLAQTVAWSISRGSLRRNHQIAEWLL